ncbi:hypothetical protein ACWGH4_00070 [Streptomyces sp. NPDC054847]
MSITTLALAALDNQDPVHAAGRADAHDDLTEGHPLAVLEQRLDWLEDARISPYPAAYLAGYRARLNDASASEYALRIATTHHDDYWSTR